MDIGQCKIKYLPNGDWIQVRVDRSCGMSPSPLIQQPFFFSFLDIIVSCTNLSIFFEIPRKFCTKNLCDEVMLLGNT